MNKHIKAALIIVLVIAGSIAIGTKVNSPKVEGAAANNSVSQLPTQSPVTDSPIPPLSDSPIPTDEPTMQPTPTDTPSSNYENYGWYTHNGQNMQYVDGQWYATAQQCEDGTYSEQNGQQMECENSQWQQISQGNSTPSQQTSTNNYQSVNQNNSMNIDSSAIGAEDCSMRSSTAQMACDNTCSTNLYNDQNNCTSQDSSASNILQNALTQFPACENAAVASDNSCMATCNAQAHSVYQSCINQ